jgi:hypothetical protein
MNSSELKIDSLVNEGMNVVDPSVLDNVQENSYQGYTLEPGDVVAFPDDAIVTAEWKIRRRPVKADYEAFENAMKELEALKTKENPTESEQEAIVKYSSWKDANDAIPSARYIIGFNPATSEPVPVLVSYLNRMGKRTSDGKYEPVDQLSSFLLRKNNASERRDALKGRAIVVDNEKHTWYVRKFGSSAVDPKEMITISIKDEPTCKVDQPVKPVE